MPLLLSLSLAVDYPGAPGLLVLQGVMPGSLPEALEEALLLWRVGGVDTCNNGRNKTNPINSHTFKVPT